VTRFCAFLNQEGAVMGTKATLIGLLLLLPDLAFAQHDQSRLEAGVFLTYAFLEEIGSTDHERGTLTLGLGGRIAWRVWRFVDVDGEVALHPEAGVSGRRVQAFLGSKAGVRFRQAGIFVKARPGFVYFSKDPFGAAAPGSTFFNPRWAHSLEPALELGGVFEYYTAKGVVVRFDLADTIVRYDARAVTVSQFQPPIAAGGFTTYNRHWSLGVAKRF
jgi:hypothetical protein